ncbi:MAG: lactonase family protein [Verrucomicrobiales bacterium]
MPNLLLVASACLFAAGSPSTVSSQDDRVYFGTYSRKGPSEGIYLARLDTETGTLSSPEVAAEASDPSFLAIAPSGDFLYSVENAEEFEGGGAVSAFAIQDSGLLKRINRQPSGGAGPCHVSIHPDGNILAVANYGAGSVASYLIGEDGSLSEPVSVIQHEGSSVNPKRQKGPHAHSINFSPDGRYAYAADLGADRVFIYSVNPDSGELSPAGEAKTDPGAGPRHFSFRPDGKYAYVINEMSLEVAAFRVDAESGALDPVQAISTLPEGTEKAGSTAEVVSHPSGKFLYGSNRGHDTIVVYSIDPDSGRLTRIENEPIQGETPRNFAVHPGGEWLLAAGQNSDSIAVFAIDGESGELEFSGQRIDVPSPVCVRFVEKD